MLQMLSTLAPRVPPGPGLRLPRRRSAATGASSEAEACGAARMCLRLPGRPERPLNGVRFEDSVQR